MCCAATSIHAQDEVDSKATGDLLFAGEQQAATDTPPIKAIRTDSPRATLASFVRLRGEMEEALLLYRANKSTELYEKVRVISAQIRALLDLSDVPLSSRRMAGNSTATYLIRHLWTH